MKNEKAEPVSKTGSTPDVDLFEQVGSDMKELIKKCGNLQHQLQEDEKKCEAEIKKILLEFLDVSDALENVFKNIGNKADDAEEKVKRWINSFRTVLKMLGRALNTSGVTPVETIIGGQSNPYWHNIVETAEKPDAEEGSILEELRKGYLWRGKILRAADICVVKNN